MPNASTGTTSIRYGSVLQIAYRPVGSASAFTVVPHYPSADELPYTFAVPQAGTYEFELTEVCSTCSKANQFSDPVNITVTIN
jgi:hypothetical protein